MLCKLDCIAKLDCTQKHPHGLTVLLHSGTEFKFSGNVHGNCSTKPCQNPALSHHVNSQNRTVGNNCHGGFGIAKVFKLARRVRDQTGPKKIDTKQCRRRKLQTISSRIVCSFSPDTRENSSLTGNEVKDRG